MRKVKVVATFGPSTDESSVTEKAIATGLDVVRLNFSHGSHKNHLRRSKHVRDVAQLLGKPLALLADLQGPKIRIGIFKDGPIKLVQGSEFTITSDDVPGDLQKVSTNYKKLPQECSIGDILLLDDGKIRLEITATTENEVKTIVVDGGPLSDRKAINLPGTTISAPSLTEKDLKDLEFAIKKLDVEYVALSFVRTGKDIINLKEQIKSLNGSVNVIAKIEKPEAVKNIDSIMDALEMGDGIMVARGDLGVELDIHKVPAIQKQLINKANKRGLITITATQMLESMTHEPMPTRAEATDVFNAVIDGTDAVMLSGETAAGNYPVEAVMAMNRLILEAESYPGRHNRSHIDFDLADNSYELATTRASCTAAETTDAKALVALTHSGRTALLMSKLSLPSDVPFIALTSVPKTFNKMALMFGVNAKLMSIHFEPKSGVWEGVDRALVETGILEEHDTVVIASGFRNGPGTTNVCKIVKLGEREYY